MAQQADWGKAEDEQDTSWDDQEQFWQEDMHGTDEEEDHDEEEAYATHMEVDQEDQSHSDEEDDDSYE